MWLGTARLGQMLRSQRRNFPPKRRKRWSERHRWLCTEDPPAHERRLDPL